MPASRTAEPMASPRRRASDWLDGFLFGPVDVAPLVYFRIVFGVTMLWEAANFLRFGWVRQLYLTPAYFFTYQGFEWVRLVQHGLTLSSGTYGGIFYVLIGCHGLHVLVAVVWLLVVAALARSGGFTAERHAALETCTLYWYLVCGLWAFLFPLVYLS